MINKNTALDLDMAHMWTIVDR